MNKKDVHKPKTLFQTEFGKLKLQGINQKKKCYKIGWMMN